MPRLRKYVDGSGYYVSDYLYGAGYCTWQIGKEGLAYLDERGVRLDRDHISTRYREELNKKGWIWVTGSNPQRLPPGAAKLPPDLRPVAEGLCRWAAHGRFTELTTVLRGTSGDQRDTCFSPRFLKWLSELDPGLRLLDLDKLSVSDFHDTAAGALDKLSDDPLYGFFVRRGEVHVLWQLSKVVAHVAQFVRDNENCAVELRQHSPVSERLFSQIRELSQPLPPKSTQWRPRRLALRPRILWDINAGQVVALLPAQRLPRGTRSLIWSMADEPLPQLQVWHDAGNRRIEEACSRALSPASSYHIETELVGESGSRKEPYRVDLPDDFTPCVFFSTDGEIRGVTEERPLAADEYLALVRRAEAARFVNRQGVHQVERIDIEPVAWHGWQGWRVRLDADADIAPYRVESIGPAASLELEAAPDLGVSCRGTLPVFVGLWPRIYCTGAEFDGAILEVGREDSPLTDHVLTVGAPGGVRIVRTAGSDFLDLAAADTLRDYYGSIRISCRLPSQPDTPPSIVRFVRLPEMTLSYVPDPVHHDEALALRIGADAKTLGDVVPDNDTEILEGDVGITLVAKAPHTSPGVVANFVEHHASLRVRLPVTRLSLVTKKRGFIGWQRAPLTDFDLSVIETGDHLRIELHDEPLLEDGKLLCRVIGGDEIAAGGIVGQGWPIWRFDVELHRWRDGYGGLATGTIQARIGGCWADIAQLRPCEASMALPPPTEIASERSRLASALHEALKQDSQAEIREAVSACHAYLDTPLATEIDRELLLLALIEAAARATSSRDDLLSGQSALRWLGPRPDIPESEIFGRMIDLRLRTPSEPPGANAYGTLESLTDGLRDLPQTDLFRAECWYRLCRATAERADGAWRSCHEWAAQFLSQQRTRPWERGAATLLRALARLTLALEIETTSDSCVSGCLGLWLNGVNNLARAMRTSQYQVSAKSTLALPDADISILTPADAALIRIGAAHAAGQPAAQAHFARLASWRREQFFGINLLRARQARLEGNKSAAVEIYDRLLKEAITDGRNSLLDVVANERSA